MDFKTIQNIFNDNDNFIIYQNGQLVNKNFDFEINQGKIVINQDINFKLVYLDNIKSNTKVDIAINKGRFVRIEEVYFNVVNDSEFLLNLYLSRDANLDLLTVRNSLDNNTIKANINAYLMENAYINNKNIVTLTGESGGVFNVYLNEKHSKAEINNVFINTSTKKQFYEVNLHHNFGYTTSSLKNYAIANNNSQITINNNGNIKKGSAQTDLHQNTKGILLDMYSQISANPLLWIDEFDVNAAHGASIGAIDEEELYYLMSRGLSKSDSEKLIISGFVSQFTDLVEDGNFKEYVNNLINKKL